MSEGEFVSYAQNSEDVLLWRALKSVQKGFYIDVGAEDPIVDSVTKAFYDRGWHGINIEPVPHWHDRLVQDRTHDLNLRVAASDRDGEMTLFEVEGTGLSTSSAEFAQRHGKNGWTVHERTVPCMTVDTICNNNKVEMVHFLKIDCEGSEHQVLSGMSLKRVRPWIIVVEATEPLSKAENWEGWEHLLTGRGYSFAYFDGLNRFYLAEEHLDLQPAFLVPPNPTDQAWRAAELNLRKSLDAVSGQLEEFRSVERVARAEAERDSLRDKNERFKQDWNNLCSERDSLRSERDNLRSERDSLRSERDRLIRENDQHEVERRAQAEQILDLRNAGSELQSIVEALRASYSWRIAHHEAEHKAQEVEILKLRNDLQELQMLVEEFRASNSWRITAPLRVCSTAARRTPALARLVVYHTLRYPAHLLRPMLRWISRCAWIRKPLVYVLGRNSHLVTTGRLFLFGARAQVSESSAGPADTGQSRIEVLAPGSPPANTAGQYRDLSSRARMVRRLMSEMPENDGDGGGHADCP